MSRVVRYGLGVVVAAILATVGFGLGHHSAQKQAANGIVSTTPTSGASTTSTTSAAAPALSGSCVIGPSSKAVSGTAYEVTITNHASTTTLADGFAVGFFYYTGAQTGSDMHNGLHTYLAPNQSFTWTEYIRYQDSGDFPYLSGSADPGGTCQVLTINPQ